MNVLVIGREGQVARSLLERAAAHPRLSLSAIGRPRLDLEFPQTLAPTIRSVAPDVVVNAAAFTAVDLAEDEPELAFRVNADGAGAVAAAAAAAAAGARVIQLSTDYVFDGVRGAPYPEDAPANPLNVYGRSKLVGEAAVRAANPRHLIVRTAWLYGPFGRNFVRTMITASRTRPFVSVVFDQRGSPTSTLVLADALLAVLDEWADGGAMGEGQTYHVAGGGDASWHDVAVATMACAADGQSACDVRPIATHEWPTRATRPAASALDCGKFSAAFGWHGPHWRESLPSVVARILADGTD